MFPTPSSCSPLTTFCSIYSWIALISFEAVEVHHVHHSSSLVLVCLYRTPLNNQNPLTDRMSLDEFPDLLASYQSINPVFTGDMNSHYDDPSDRAVNTIKTLLHDHSLFQLIDGPTHTHGHILDWLIVRDVNSQVDSVTVRDLQISDHKAIFFCVSVKKPKWSKRLCTARNLKKVKVDLF